MIPAFDDLGNLPPGIHEATWDEFIERFGYNSERRKLIAGLHSAMVNLKAAGCAAIYVDGSFVTNKRVPQDYDACWETQGVDRDKADPVIKRINGQQEKYLGDLFPEPISIAGDSMLLIYQQDRAGNRKGVVKLDVRRF